MPRPGQTDVVPAMLTPGEAVLVPEVAEAVGRHNIEAANQHAVAKRKGIVPLEGYACGASKVQGYATGTPDVQQNNSAVQTAVKSPIQSAKPIYKSGNSYSDKPNMLNSATGITTVGGGNNGQSITNQFTKIAPPVAGMPGVSSSPSDNNLAKQNLFARTAMDTAARYGKAGNFDTATGIMQDLKAKPMVNTENRVSALESQFGKPDASITQDINLDMGKSKFTALADENGIQGYDEGTSAVRPAKEPKFRGGVSTFSPSDDALKEANQTYLTEPPIKQEIPVKPARQVGGKSTVGEFTPSAEEISAQRYNPVEGKAGGLGNLPNAEKAIQQNLYEKSLGVPQTGPFSKVPPRSTIGAGKNLVPVSRKGIVPVGEVTSEPTKYQFRPGRGGYAPEVQAPGTGLVPAGPRITAEEANKVYADFEAENAAKVAPGAKSAAAQAAENLANPKPSGAWRPMSAGEAAKQSAQAAAEKAAIPGWETGMRHATIPNLKGIVPTANKLLGTAGSVLGAAHEFSQPSGVEVYARKRAEIGDPQAKKVVAEGGVNPITNRLKGGVESAANTVEAPISEAVAKGAQNVKDYVGAAADYYLGSDKAEPSLAAPVKTAAPTAPVEQSNPVQEVQPEQTFAPKAAENGQYRIDLDDQGQFIQSANKVGIERVAKGLNERGGIVKAASRPAAGASDFWINRGYPGGAAQYKAEQEQQALQDVALNGGGTGNMSVSEFRRANARQKSAQGILADRERINAQKENLAAENKKSDASLAATAAERAYQHRKDEKEALQKRDEYEQRERLAGEKPVKIGEDIMPTKDVPAYQARKAHEAKVATLTDYVKKNSGLFSGSDEDALVEGLIQQGDQEGTELAELKAYLNVAKPEQKKQIEAEIQKRTAPYRSALNA